MAKMLASALALAIATLYLTTATASGSCNMNQQWVEQAAISCMVHEPNLMLQMAGHMQSPNEMESFNFVCKHQSAIVEMLDCLEHKLLGCIPQAQMVKHFIPDHTHLMNILGFICQNRDIMLDPNCMTPDSNQEFTTCVQGYVQEILSSTFELTTEAKVQVAVCEVVKGTQQCLDKYHGACPKENVSAYKQLIAMIVPTDNCGKLPNTDMNKEMKNALRSVLVGGEPLKFRGEGSLPNGK